MHLNRQKKPAFINLCSLMLCLHLHVRWCLMLMIISVLFCCMVLTIWNKLVKESAEWFKDKQNFKQKLYWYFICSKWFLFLYKELNALKVTWFSLKKTKQVIIIFTFFLKENKPHAQAIPQLSEFLEHPIVSAFFCLNDGKFSFVFKVSGTSCTETAFSKRWQYEWAFWSPPMAPNIIVSRGLEPY